MTASRTRTTSNDAYAYTAELDVERAYAANGLNQYTAAGSATFLYDANGNLTSDGSSSYVYDVENRLIQSSGPKSATLRYDPAGRLHETSAGTAASTTRMLYDGDELTAEYNSSGAMLRRYVHGAGSDDPLVWYEGAAVSAATRRHMFANYQGSITTVADSAGAGLAINRYDEWGIPAASNLGRFQYTGQAWLPEIGMYYYKARIYSPTLGRFMQTDPIGYADQVNLYAYVGNDPGNMVDPDGMESGSVAYNSIVSLTEARAADHDPERARTEMQALAIGASFLPLGRVAQGIAWTGRAVGIGKVVTGLMRGAEVFKPVASGAAALMQRASAVSAGLKQLATGQGSIRVIAGAGAKAEFRGAEAAAARYGGEAADYTKVSVSSVTKAGDRVSVHAIRNETTGKIFEQKVIYGR